MVNSDTASDQHGHQMLDPRRNARLLLEDSRRDDAPRCDPLPEAVPFEGPRGPCTEADLDINATCTSPLPSSSSSSSSTSIASVAGSMSPFDTSAGGFGIGSGSGVGSPQGRSSMTLPKSSSITMAYPLNFLLFFLGLSPGAGVPDAEPAKADRFGAVELLASGVPRSDDEPPFGPDGPS